MFSAMMTGLNGSVFVRSTAWYKRTRRWRRWRLSGVSGLFVAALLKLTMFLAALRLLVLLLLRSIVSCLYASPNASNRLQEASCISICPTRCRWLVGGIVAASRCDDDCSSWRLSLDHALTLGGDLPCHLPPANRASSLPPFVPQPLLVLGIYSNLLLIFLMRDTHSTSKWDSYASDIIGVLEPSGCTIIFAELFIYVIDETAFRAAPVSCS